MYSDKVLGFTCVENQVLSIIEEYNQPIWCMYYDSAIPLQELYAYIVLGDTPFYKFNLIMRAQDALKKLGVIEMCLLNLKIQEIEGILSADKKYLIRLKPAFINSRIHMRTIREDHFLMIEKDNNLYRLTNDIPNISIYIDSDELANSFDGQMFVINYIRGITQDDIAFLNNIRKYKAENVVAYEDNYKFTDINLHRVVDLLVVYKILKQRMAEYYSNKIDTSFITTKLDYIEKLRLKSQYLVLRKDANGIRDILKSLLELESNFWGDLVGQLT